MIVAGGLGVDNVGEVVRKGFFGVDASSRLERGGVGGVAKDDDLVTEFIKKAEEANK